MTEGQRLMSRKEVDRLRCIQAVMSKQLGQADATRPLGLSVRQVKRLVACYRQPGASGFVSGHRGKRPNNAIAEEVRQEVLSIVRKCYADFGPTLACEKRVESHHSSLSAETLRQWMIADGLWVANRCKQARLHPRRPRRSGLGELVQIDGSPHAWFEDRGSPCTLLVFIDDATSRLLALRFVPAETTQAYMETLSGYLNQYGRPVALYSDKHSIFRVNAAGRSGELTQFSRALKTLDIDPIHANSPQAKGRVERANQTLQDRLVKELRLHGISDRNAAKAFLPAFMIDYNQRFGIQAQHPRDAHREVLPSTEERALILCLHATRRLSKNLTCQFKNREYPLQVAGQGYRLRGATVTLCETFEGTVTILHNGRPMAYRLLAEGEPPIPLEDEKSIHHSIEQAKAKQQARPIYKPAPDHPWNQETRIAAARAAQR